MTTLSEDSIDEILYLARANEPAELSTYVAELATQTGVAPGDVLLGAVDAFSKNSALHYAAANGHDDVVTYLVATGTPALLNSVNDAGNTALHWAALNGHLASVKALIAAGADVTIFNKAGHDAVFEAEVNDKKDVVDWLLGHVDGLEKSIGGAGGSGEEEMTFRVGDTSGVENVESIESVTEGVQGLDTKDTKDG